MLQSDRLAVSREPNLKSYFGLPVQFNGLVGREQVAAALEVRLRQSDTRLVSLTGPGGVGKTCLALRVAATLEEHHHFAKVHFVNLSPITEAEQMIKTIAQSLGIKEKASSSIYTILVEKLSDQPTLLVIDNFEQVLAAAPLLAELIEDCLGLKLLVTSRAPLRLSFEHEFLLAPLELKAAVTLFEQRAKAIRADFQLTSSNLDLVTEICQCLEGLPLAIELAASRTRLLPLPALLERMDKRLELLTGGARDLPVKQQTLRSTIEWSYNLLTPAQQLLFRSLAIFVGGASLEILETVTPTPAGSSTSFLDNVQTLIEHNLLKPAQLDSPTPRLFMLETIRQFALEKLEESGEREALQAAVAISLTEIFDNKVKAGLAQSDARILALMDPERDNIRAVLHWAIEQRKVEIALRLATMCWQYWRARGYLNEGRQYLEQALTITEIAPPELRAKALNALGAIFRLQGAFARAQQCFSESLGLYQQIEDWLGIAITNRWIGMTFKEQDELTASRIYLEDSLKLFRQIGDKSWIAAVLHPLGDVELAEGNYEQALSYQRESMAICQQLGDECGLGVSLANLGTIAVKQELYHLGMDYYRQSLQDLQAINDKTVVIVIALVGCLVGELGSKDSPGVNRALLETAGRFLGAASALMADLSMAFCLIERQCFEQTVQTVRYYLGDEVFTRMYTAGQHLTLEKALAEVFSLIDELSAITEPVEDSPAVQATKAENHLKIAGLTAREGEVLKLVAQGLTNRQIAQALVLSELTVASYLHSVYSKLGVSSRAAATRYVIENSLPM